MLYDCRHLAVSSTLELGSEKNRARWRCRLIIVFVVCSVRHISLFIPSCLLCNLHDVHNRYKIVRPMYLFVASKHNRGVCSSPGIVPAMYVIKVIWGHRTITLVDAWELQVKSSQT
jgi:hypothetical protein